MLEALVPRIPRGHGRATVFHKPQDYEAFLSLLADAKKRHRMKLLGFACCRIIFTLFSNPLIKPY